MRQPDHEYEERSFGDIQRAIDFENSMNDLESQLYYQHLSPKEVAQQVLKATCQFYDADWCGLIQVDLDLNLWTPFWWFNAGATDKTMLLTEEYESAEFLDRWVQTVRKGIPMVVPDAEATKEAYPAEYNLYQRLGIRSVIAVSLEPRPVALLAVRNPKRYIQQTSMLRILAYVLLASYNEQKMLNRLQMAYIPTSIQSSKDIYVSLFGELSISTSKGVLKEADFSSPSINRLISYLLISRKNAISPQEITQTLWSDDSDNPAKNVKGLVYRLRQKFSIISDEPLVLSSASGYQLNPELHIMTDYQRFDELVSSAVRASSVINKVDILKNALDLYHGKVLSSADGEHSESEEPPMTENKNRVCCLYRVSTDKQVDFNSNHEADLPMQRKACHKFAEAKGWVIVHEEQEEGVSGHKVRAEARDKLQIIKEYARKGKFDILLVFMFDRIGRIADETPFVVEWFVRNGIRVWSTQEGEQRFDNHTDKLLNYIRFWQADGESEKTSVRTRTSLRQLVEEGHFKGGSAPYGYDLVKSGRINKRKHELYELHINEQEAEIVRLIFDKYVYEGYGAQRIATYLNNAGYRARSGKCWHPGSLRGMVGNLTYMGVLRCGDARSELMPELQIIPQEEFEAAQRIREDRSAHAAEEAEHHVPLRTRGQALLSNNVYCGHCGARLALTTSRKWRKLSDGTLDDTLRIRYTCYGKLRKQTDCTGQTGYTMHILDEIIDKMVRQIFSRLRGIPKEQLITSRYAKETAERKNHLQALQAERDKAEKDLLALKTEILAVIKGESAFPKDTLAEMIAAQEKKHTELDTLCEEASAELERNAELMANVSQLYEELISYADLYDSASFEAKKMIVSQLIRRVEVYRGYQIHVDFNFDLAQYLENSDELAC